jgi:hypothetical protein
MPEADKHELQEELAGGTDQTESDKNQAKSTPEEKRAKPIGEKRPVPDSEPAVDQGRDAELEGRLKPDKTPVETGTPHAGEAVETETGTPETSASAPETPGAETPQSKDRSQKAETPESVPETVASDTPENTSQTKPHETPDPGAGAGTAEVPQSTSQSKPEKTPDPTPEEVANEVGESGTETKTEEAPDTAPETTHPQTDEKPEVPETEKPSEKSEDSEETAEGEDSDETEDSEGDIDKTIAEDAEDTENQRRHQIPFLDYHALSMENLVGELQRLMRSEKVQSIRRHVEAIRKEFNLKFQEFIEEKKEEFISRGGEASDFSYNSVTKRQFNELYSEYREQRGQYYKNLEERLSIIEQLKGLVSVEENMNSTYKSFKELQERWKKAGPVPRTQYNDVWRTYQHHLEIFYDFLSLNRELRDLDFKHNLGEKEKLSQRAEALLEEPDINKAFRELQILHKIWKEDIGPVGKEHREAIWERFSEATRKMHDRRQGYFQELDKRYQGNLEEKQKIIARIEEVSFTVAKNHKEIQKQIREIETLRDQFFKAGKVPQKDNEATWSAFKAAVRKFNRGKNAFYKNLKKEQHLNLDRKKSLLERAIALKDSEDWDTVTPEMKKIQREWKEIGHVPRKYSDAIWKEFKAACNHYFDRLHSKKNSAFDQEKKNLKLKLTVLDELKGFELTGKREEDLNTIKDFVKKWKEIGHVPRNKMHVTSKFNKILDALFRKLNVGSQEAEILKYGDRIADLAKEEDSYAIEQERQFIRKKIEEIKGEIRQLENNLNFFSEPSEENPLVKEVLVNLEKKKKGLENWKAKLKKLNILRNNLNSEAANSEAPEASEDDAVS